MTKEKLAEQKYPIVESTGSSHWTRMDINEKERLVFISGYDTAEHKWIRVEDELPKRLKQIDDDEEENSSENVLGCDTHSGWVYNNSVQYNYLSKKWRMNGDYLSETVDVTHWMPLPKFPKND